MSVAAAQVRQHAAVRQIELALEWARLHPCRDNQTPRTGVRPTCTTRAWSRWPVQVLRGSLSSHPPTSPPRSATTQDAGRQLLADALELVYRLPATLGAGVAGVVPVWRARLIARETTDLAGGGAVRRPADRRHAA